MFLTILWGLALKGLKVTDKQRGALSLFLNSLVESFSLISLGKLFQKRIPPNKSEVISLRVEFTQGKCNVFPFLKSYGKKLMLKL